jgi:hypothetical protein
LALFPACQAGPVKKANFTGQGAKKRFPVLFLAARQRRPTWFLPVAGGKRDKKSPASSWDAGQMPLSV